MRRIYLAIFFLVSIFSASAQQVDFVDYFTNATMRIDYHHTGDAVSELVTIDHIYGYDKSTTGWAGSLVHLIDNFNNGAYYYKIYDAGSGRLIFSKGFDSYFKEYQTSEAAASGIKKAFHESAIIPYPNKSIIFSIEKRDKQNLLNEIFTLNIDPADYYIIKDEVKDKNTTVIKSLDNGNPHSKLDVAILGDGYTIEEKDKFEKDLKRFTELLINHEPFKTHKKNINVYGVFKPSEEIGTDEPGAGIYKNTVLNTTFYSLGSERYLLTEDNKTMRDLAAFVPYDAIYIMVNSPRYGGGGIYNFYCTFASDNQFSDYIFLHEFGHSFAGLADEYYTSDVAYNEFYTAGLEPVEPNITRLLDKENLKWKHLISQGIELPTLWEKKDYDATDYKWQKERREMNRHIADLKRSQASKTEIEAAQDEYNKKDKAHSDEVDKYLKGSKFWNLVGAFEGAGYSAEGMYRPMLDCLMFSKGTKPFCKVCEEHTIKVMRHFIE